MAKIMGYFVRLFNKLIAKHKNSCFIGVSRHLETIKALGRSVSQYSDEAIALVFDILHEIVAGACKLNSILRTELKKIDN